MKNEKNLQNEKLGNEVEQLSDEELEKVSGGLTDEQWAALAQLSGLSVEELKKVSDGVRAIEDITLERGGH